MKPIREPPVGQGVKASVDAVDVAVGGPVLLRAPGLAAILMSVSTVVLVNAQLPRGLDLCPSQAPA
jgi:hypothetical protein